MLCLCLLVGLAFGAADATPNNTAILSVSSHLTAEDVINAASKASKAAGANSDQMKALTSVISGVQGEWPKLSSGSTSAQGFVNIVGIVLGALPPPAGPAFAAVATVISSLMTVFGTPSSSPPPLTLDKIGQVVRQVIAEALEAHDVAEIAQNLYTLNNIVMPRIEEVKEAPSIAVNFKDFTSVTANPVDFCEVNSGGVPAHVLVADSKVSSLLANMLNQPGPFHLQGTNCHDDAGSRWDSSCVEQYDNPIKGKAFINSITRAYLATATSLLTYYQALNTSMNEYRSRPDFNKVQAFMTLDYTWKNCRYESLMTNANAYVQVVSSMNDAHVCPTFFQAGAFGASQCSVVQHQVTKCDLPPFHHVDHIDCQDTLGPGWIQAGSMSRCGDCCGLSKLGPIGGGHQMCSRCTFAAPPTCVASLQGACHSIGCGASDLQHETIVV
jgi:hypothetical protein